MTGSGNRSSDGRGNLLADIRDAASGALIPSEANRIRCALHRSRAYSDRPSGEYCRLFQQSRTNPVPLFGSPLIDFSFCDVGQLRIRALLFRQCVFEKARDPWLAEYGGVLYAQDRYAAIS